jgi:hypothetical protein
MVSFAEGFTKMPPPWELEFFTTKLSTSVTSVGGAVYAATPKYIAPPFRLAEFCKNTFLDKTNTPLPVKQAPPPTPTAAVFPTNVLPVTVAAAAHHKPPP